MHSKTAVIKVLYHQREINYDEIIKMTSFFKYFLVINNSQFLLQSNFPDITNFSILNNYNINGLAGAYNLGISKLRIINPDFVLLLDEDTPTSQVFDICRDDFYASFIDNDVAAVAPTYMDLNSATRGSHILMKRFSFKTISRSHIGISNVSFMINSCSMWRYNCLVKIGKYDEQMQLDHIDTDYCLRAVQMGYRLLLNSNYCFSHEIGNRISYRFFFLNFRSGNHSPFRRRLIIRNSIILMRKHFNRFPILLYVMISRIIYEILGIIVAEKNRNKKIKMSLKGLINGFFIKLTYGQGK